MHVKIRKGTAADIDQFLQLLAQVNLIHHRGRPDLFNAGQKYTRQELEAMLSNPDTPILVAADATTNQCVGYAMCQLEHYDMHNSHIQVPRLTLYLDDLCVDAASRGQHVGHRLYDACCQLARELGCHNITLHAWSCNPTAVAFYERMGMRPYMLGMETIVDQEKDT